MKIFIFERLESFVGTLTQLLPIMLLFSLFITAWLSLYYEQNYLSQAFNILFLLILLFYSRKTFAQIRRYLPYLIIFILITSYRGYITILIQCEKIYYSRYELNNCINRSVRVDNVGYLGVCQKIDDPYTETTSAIIYDTTGQIARPFSTQSQDWLNAANGLQKLAPFGILKFSSRHIIGDFYDVTFDYQS